MGAAPIPLLPRYTGTDPQMRDWANDLCQTLETWATLLNAPVGEVWTVNGIEEHRDVDPAVLTTFLAVTDVIGTLVRDLHRGAPLSVI